MKHVVITGGTGGLGKAIATEFLTAGWVVDAPGSRDLDVTDPAAIRSYFHGKPVDLLICSAGITRDAPLPKLDETRWDEVISVNLTGARHCASVVLPNMISRGFGHIIFISSNSAIHPPVGQAAYATSKAALLGLTKDLAARYGPENIRINAILPGFLETPMTKSVTPARRKKILSEHTLGRFNSPETVAAFIRFLTEHLPHTSGQIFQLDSRTGENF